MGMENNESNEPELKPSKKDKMILWSVLAGLLLLFLLIYIGIGL